MTSTANDRARRSRRLIVLVGGLALVVLFVVGALVNVPAIERDLSTAVENRLQASDIAAFADFSGQTGVLFCRQPLPDPDLAISVAGRVRGVRSVSLDATCIGSVGPTPSSSTIVPTTSVAPPTTGAPTTTAAASTTTVPAPIVGVTTVDLVDGHLTLGGAVANDQQHATLLIAAADSADASNVTDLLVVDPTVQATDDQITQLASLVGAMLGPLVSGQIGWSPEGLYARGVYTDDAARAQFTSSAAGLGATVALTPRPVATADDAAALETALNELVQAEPILFDKGATTVALVSYPTLQRVAGLAKRFGGVTIQVQGHTDSEGDAGRNQTLSEQRADAVRAALVQLGVPAADITSVGFGESQLITDANGKEIPELSRRVVFGVTKNS